MMNALTCPAYTHYSCDFARLQLAPNIFEYLSFAFLVILLRDILC